MQIEVVATDEVKILEVNKFVYTLISEVSKVKVDVDVVACHDQLTESDESAEDCLVVKIDNEIVDVEEVDLVRLKLNILWLNLITQFGILKV